MNDMKHERECFEEEDVPRDINERLGIADIVLVHRDETRVIVDTWMLPGKVLDDPLRYPQAQGLVLCWLLQQLFEASLKKSGV